LFTPQSETVDALLDIRLYGKEPHSIQTMWSAVDDWVIRSSNFHSLYELYGHFTEPHPVFSINDFKIFSKHPIAKFAIHASKFENCSRYFPRNHLVQMFGDVFDTSNFPQLARILREFRFDIRCHETNIAIAPHLYMVAYPFTLPFRKQMNFSVRVRKSLAPRALV
jgi:DNA (cytosine-5)-methyltransferase 1